MGETTPTEAMIESQVQKLHKTMHSVVETARAFPAGYVHHKPTPEAFSATEIIYHLVAVEELWQGRLTQLRPDGSAQFSAFDPDGEAKRGNHNVQPFTAGIEAFIAARTHTIATVQGLSAEQLRWHGAHPKYGVLDVPAILEIMANHDLGHVAQFGRTEQAVVH